MTAKILILDIETAPNLAYVWGAWKQNIGQNQWVEKSYIMSIAYKWLNGDEIYYMENRDDNDAELVAEIYSLLDEADVVVAHNGQKFDLPTIIGRGVVHGYSPPSPYYVVDTLLVARKELRLVSNTLANLCEQLGLTEKLSHKQFPGFELWKECLKGNPEAWEEMRVYNIQDVESLEELYLRLRPYMRNHPNVSRPDEEGVVACAKCGSTNIQYRGYYYTRAGLCYRRFVCLDCGGWNRERFSEKDIPVNNGRNAT